MLLLTNSHPEEDSHVVKLPPHICVEQALVAFTASPEHYVQEKTTLILLAFIILSAP